MYIPEPTYELKNAGNPKRPKYNMGTVFIDLYRQVYKITKDIYKPILVEISIIYDAEAFIWKLEMSVHVRAACLAI